MSQTQQVDESRTIVIEKTAFLPSQSEAEKSGASATDSSPNKSSGIVINIQPFLERILNFRRQALIRELIAEGLGTFLLCLLGLSSVAQYVFNKRAGSPTAASFLSVNLGFGIGVVVAILVTGKVSGCHINPAVSLAMFITGRLNLVKLALYSLVQTFGAFCAAAVVYLLYCDAFNVFREILYGIETAGIFATYPGSHLSLFGGLFDQIVGTAVLIIVVLAVTDKRNVEIPHASVAILLGLTVTVIGAAFAYNCGYAINPARDLGPRLFTFVAGWGTKVFSHGNYFFWIPIVGPLVGSFLGTLIYLLLISNNL